MQNAANSKLLLFQLQKCNILQTINQYIDLNYKLLNLNVRNYQIKNKFVSNTKHYHYSNDILKIIIK